MQETTTIHLSEYDVKEIVKNYLKSKRYKVVELEVIVRGKEGDIQIPKGASGDCLGIEAKVEK